MELFWISTYLCIFCIFKACYVCNVPHLEGGITGHILDFNCSTSQKPFKETVEIVKNGRSQFNLVHFNTTCIRKQVKCKPNDCSCTANWFQFKMAIQDPTVILKIQCLMRFEEHIKKIVKANIAFNGSYFWDDLAYQNLITPYTNFSRTTKVTPNTSTNSGHVIRDTLITCGILVFAIIIIIIVVFNRCTQPKHDGYALTMTK